MKKSDLQTVVEVDNARLVFQHGFDERDAYNALGAGYLSHVAVELDDGSRYPVVFYDAERLRQDLAEEAKHGAPCIAEPGMIVLAEVSLEHMKNAIKRLRGEGYFSRLKSADASHASEVKPNGANSVKGGVDEDREWEEIDRISPAYDDIAQYIAEVRPPRDYYAE